MQSAIVVRYLIAGIAMRLGAHVVTDDAFFLR